LSEIQRRIEYEFVSELLIGDIDAIASDLLVVERFVRQAKQLLLKITKKHDKMTRYKVNTWLLVRLENEPWWDPKFGIYYD
jgi:SPX domain protein involved in polyphosphate accumulation